MIDGLFFVEDSVYTQAWSCLSPGRACAAVGMLALLLLAWLDRLPLIPPCCAGLRCFCAVLCHVMCCDVQNVVKILGLKFSHEYTDTKSLRYGHLMIMTDQDHDGSHIKGKPICLRKPIYSTIQL